MAVAGGQWERGMVRFGSAPDFEREFEGFISKGAVRIGAGDGIPAPLEPFDFQLVPPGGAPVPLRGMIVSNTAGIALVQILEFSPALVASIRSGGAAAARAMPRPTPSGLETVPAGATAAPTAPPPLLAMKLSASGTNAPGLPAAAAAAPATAAASAAASATAAASAAAAPVAATVPPVAAPRPPVAATLPPPVAATLPPPGAAGGTRTTRPLPALNMPTAPPTVLPSAPPTVLPTAPPTVAPGAPNEAFDQGLDWATPSPLAANPATTGVFPVLSAPPSAGPIAGLLVNPQGLDGLLQLPLGPIAAVRDLAMVSTVGLLRFMGARRVSGNLTLAGDAGGERRVSIASGSFLLSPQERDGLRPIFQWPTGRYVFEPDTPDRPPHRLPVSAWRLVLDFVRLAVREARPDDLAARTDATLAVRLTAAFAERARTLDLSPAEERIVRRDFNGKLSLREIYKLGAMAELSVQRLVLLLQALGLCELLLPEGDKQASATDEVRAHYQRLVSGDLFAALGMHWSDPPERVPIALEAARARYRVGSPAATSSPVYAAKLMELAERAHRRLIDRAGRRAYRTEMGVDVRHAAELLVQQVPLAKARGEYRKAFELMSAACDLFDRPEWERLRADLAHTTSKTST